MYNICGAMASLIDQAAEYYKRKEKNDLSKIFTKKE